LAFAWPLAAAQRFKYGPSVPVDMPADEYGLVLGAPFGKLEPCQL
jgi:hypothetical protein